MKATTDGAHRRTPALERATEYLGRSIEQARAANRPRLPTLDRMSREAGVALATMWSAIKLLRERGVLDTGKQIGIRVCGVTPVSRVSAEGENEACRARWPSLAAKILLDITNGVFVSGAALPSVKQLQHRYGTGYRSVRSSLESLAERGIVEATGRTWRVVRLASTAHSPTVVLVARGAERGALAYVSARTQDNYRALENACRRAGVRLGILLVEYDKPKFYGPPGLKLAAEASAGGDESVLGFLFWTTSISTPNVVTLAARLNATGKPLALFDDTGMFPELPAEIAAPAARLFTSGCSTNAGRCVGRYLLERGHRRAAFISHLHDTTWSRMRLAGLVESFSEAGLAGAVHAFTCEESEQIRLDTNTQIAAIQQRVQQMLQGEIRSGPQRGVMVWRARQAVFDKFSDLLRIETCRYIISPLLRRALAHQDCTAWVVPNDMVGLECVDFLRRSKVRVPKDKSVVGFDDASDAFVNGLSSYNFNGPALIELMLAHVLHPQPERSRMRQRKAIEVDGFVTERGTAHVR